MMDDAHVDQDEVAIAHALGSEIRRAREAGGWSRAQFVARLPSRISSRTYVAYELGARQLSIMRFLELCRELGIAAPVVLHQALLNARLELHNLVLHVDLRGLLADTSDRFRLIFDWARNRIPDASDGVVELPPVAVREMAALIGCSHLDLAQYLVEFTPDRGSA